MDGKTIYAQSSDIKSRTFLEYRKDMKHKAIIELEMLEWLNKKVRQQYGKSAIVSKSGGDAFLWFLRKGGISRAPDYRVDHANSIHAIEMQYGSNLVDAGIYDFKISKISPKKRSSATRLPNEDIVIFYLFKDSPTKYAFLSPKWIYENSERGVAAAWGNAPTYKLPASRMLTQVKEDPSLAKIWEQVRWKWFFLYFQYELIEKTKKRIADLLQKNVDENKLIKIIPNTLNSFFEVCFLLDLLQKQPASINKWLIYALSYINKKSTSEDIFKIVYSIDFLYTKTAEVSSHELQKLIEAINQLFAMLLLFAQKNGSYVSDKRLSPFEETRNCLFIINLLEDLTQDILYYHRAVEGLKPINKIYMNIPYPRQTWKFIQT